jgi:hypothetical protein
LRAKQRHDRWEEEVTTVKYEAKWTVTWFEDRKEKWNGRAERAKKKELRGHCIYAEKQKEMWEMHRAKAAYLLRDIMRQDGVYAE